MAFVIQEKKHLPLRGGVCHVFVWGILRNAVIQRCTGAGWVMNIVTFSHLKKRLEFNFSEKKSVGKLQNTIGKYCFEVCYALKTITTECGVGAFPDRNLPTFVIVRKESIPRYKWMPIILNWCRPQLGHGMHTYFQKVMFKCSCSGPNPGR